MNTYIKEIAMEARGLKQGKDPSRLSSSPFLLIEAEYPDVLIMKKNSRTTRTMGVILSENVYFIKTETSNGEPSFETLTAESYVKFASGMPDIELPEGFWTDKFRSGTAFARALIEFLGDETLVRMTNERLLPKGANVINYRRYGDALHAAKKAYQNDPAIYKMVLDMPKSMDFVLEEPLFCKSLVSRYGLDGLRHFFGLYEDAMISYSDKEHSSYISPRNRMVCDGPFYETVLSDEESENVDRIAGYMFYDAVHMGYSSHPDRFVSDWASALKLQQQIYGKIEHAYPEDLPTYLKQLRYKNSCLFQLTDDEKLRLHYRLCSLQPLNGTYNDLVFRAPRKGSELVDDLVSQVTSVSGLLEEVLSGEKTVFFAMRKDEPETPYITVCVDRDGNITAARTKNEAVSDKDMESIRGWVNGGWLHYVSTLDDEP